jgi:(3R)-3-hydroxyacyl-CoA dehydrogenase / 3a,7a,12a-trihydroxy-5b-cholest-24-enoyl-CoA hydratase / enoyl-CoA hydratase 2
MTLRFDDRVVVVTGAGAGLGREYALLFASRGAKVVVNDLGGSFHGEGQSKAADVVVKEITDAGGIAVPDYNSVVEGHKVIETAISKFGRVDILINNAGILRDKSIANITDDDWDKINDIHLKASFITTRAAWPYFKKQNYGRIIMTASNSGVYGNFGQANYSAAKLGAAGLANTVAIEGARYNIHCNTIVPTAASRMTKDILPEEFYNELKPALIAPVVAYLCHENTEDNGNIIESACGWATKVHFIRGKGSLLRTSITDGVTPEFVRDRWDAVTDMSQATHLNSIGEASASFMGILEELKNPSSASSGSNFEDTFSFSSRDLILYALGIGVSTDDEDNLRYLYENHPDFAAFPTFSVMPGIILSMTSGLVSSKLANFDLSQVNTLELLTRLD